MRECDEEKKIMSSFGKTTYTALTIDQWKKIYEHMKQCKVCQLFHPESPSAINAVCERILKLDKMLIKMGKKPSDQTSSIDERIQYHFGTAAGIRNHA